VSDELPDTADKAIRLWLAAVGFTLVLLGGEMMAEKDGARFGIGLVLVLVALPVHLLWVFWEKIKPRLAKGVVLEIGTIATSPRWWFGLLFLLIAALIFTPVIQVPRWPSWPRTALATIPTSLRLQFNAVGVNPEEIEKRNIDWTTYRYTETKKAGAHTRKICTENQPPPQPYSQLGATQLFITPSQPSINCAEETFPDYADNRYVTFILFFPVTIEAKEIKLNSHGAVLPQWEKLSVSGNSAVIRFNGELTRMILDVEILN
jgi:hypothetical protein